MRKATLTALIGFVAMIGPVSTVLPTAAAQSVQCVEEPLLAVVDSDGDGIATADEIRSFSPDNADLQANADQLEAEGVTGIRYADCGNATPAADSTKMSDSTQAVGGNSDNEGATQTELPTSESASNGDRAVVMPIVGLLGIAALAAALLLVVRRSK